MSVANGKIPRIVAKIQGQLGDSLTDKLKLVDFKAKVSGSDVNLLKTTMRQAMAPTQREDFSAADKDLQMTWIYHYLVDPVGGNNSGWNKTIGFKKQLDKTGWQWLTEEQIADELKSEENARILVESNELDEQLHEYKSLANKGVKQYHFHKSIMEKSTGLVEEAGTSSKHELTVDEYTALSDHMEANVGVACKRKRPVAPPKPPESPESQAFKKAKVAWSCSLNKCKTLTDKINNELGESKMRTEQITKNGYPPEMATHYLAKIKLIQKNA